MKFPNILRLNSRSRRPHFILLACLASVLALGVRALDWHWSFFGTAGYLDSFGQDMGFSVRGDKSDTDVANLPQSQNILIVSLPHEVNRTLLAHLVTRLKSARAVALDLMLISRASNLSSVEKSVFRPELKQWQHEDQTLAGAMKQANNVIIGAWPDREIYSDPSAPGQEKSKLVWIPPAPIFCRSARWIAHLHVVPDEDDGNIRRANLWEKNGEFNGDGVATPTSPAQYTLSKTGQLPPILPSLALCAAAAETASHLQPHQLAAPLATDRHHATFIDYLGPRASFTGNSNFMQADMVLSGAPLDYTGKIVFVGQTDYRSKDTFPTPRGDMPGVMIHANLAATLLDSQGPPRPIGWPLLTLLTLGSSFFIVSPLIRHHSRSWLPRIRWFRAPRWLSRFRLVRWLASRKSNSKLDSPVLKTGYPFWACLPFLFFGTFFVTLLVALIFTCFNIVTPLSVLLGAMFLTYNFAGIYEYAKARSTLKRVVGPGMLPRMLDTLENPTLGGEKTEATAFFCDLRGYTEITRQLEPGQLVSLLNFYTNALVSVVQKWGGRPIDYFGDGVFVLFEGKNHARQAIEAALDAQKTLETQFNNWPEMTRINTEFAHIPDLRVRMGIALDTGTMVVGLVGAQNHLKPGAVGDPVNIASRVQGLTDRCAYSILITRNTLEKSGLTSVVPDVVPGDSKLSGAPLVGGENSLTEGASSSPDSAPAISTQALFCGRFTVKGRQEPLEVFGVGQPKN